MAFTESKNSSTLYNRQPLLANFLWQVWQVDIPSLGPGDRPLLKAWIVSVRFGASLHWRVLVCSNNSQCDRKSLEHLVQET